jgi:hypothetical protein
MKIADAAASIRITFQVMTVTGQSTGNQNAINTFLKSPQKH